MSVVAEFDLPSGTTAVTYQPGSRALLLERAGNSTPLTVQVRGEDDVRRVLEPELAARVLATPGRRVAIGEGEETPK